MLLSRHGATRMRKDSREKEFLSQAVNITDELTLEVSRTFEITYNETRLYLTMLHGTSYTANQLSKITGIHRTRIYDNLRGLESKNLIMTQESDPRLFKALTIDTSINYRLQELKRIYDSKKEAAVSIGSQLQQFQFGHQKPDDDSVYLVPFANALPELRILLEGAQQRVWVSKRTAGGIIDWFVLKDDLNNLSTEGVDIRFLSDTHLRIGYTTRILPSITHSFAIIDSTAISFLDFDESKLKGKMIVTRDQSYVSFLAIHFCKSWQLSET